MEKDYYKGKKILVTGGAGSIGSQLVRELLHHNPAIVRVLDNNETGLFDLEKELNSESVRILIGDVRDRERLIMAMEGTDIVFHAAALKHVPLCEFNPFDAVKTNVLGTQNVLEAALINDVGKVINVSTDKAVSPTNVMGATKLLTERLTISANHYKGKKKTVFSSVRFGNVLNSRGSVIPLFLSQIRNGGPVTVTHKDMTRFYMDIPTAVNLILHAGSKAQGRELFILKMPALNILDLAKTMIKECARSCNRDPKTIKIRMVGKRSGEKLFEELMTDDEFSRAYENDSMYIIGPEAHPYEAGTYEYRWPKEFRKASSRDYTSNTAHLIDKNQMKKLIHSLA